jgi:hypothetical protein
MGRVRLAEGYSSEHAGLNCVMRTLVNTIDCEPTVRPEMFLGSVGHIIPTPCSLRLWATRSWWPWFRLWLMY